MKTKYILIFLLIIINASFAIATENTLPAVTANNTILQESAKPTNTQDPFSLEQPFIFNAYLIDPNTLQFGWNIAPNTLLYKNKIKILNGSDYTRLITTKEFPTTNLHYEEPEHIAVFTKELTIKMSWPQELQSSGILIRYQGCNADGFCYTPEYKQLTINNKQLTITDFTGNKSIFKKKNGTSIKQSKTNTILSHLTTHSTPLTLLIFFALGILLTFTPCTLPLLPITVNIILGSESKTKPYRSTIILSIYILSMASCYTAVGVATAYLGTTMQIFLQTPWVLIVTSFLLAIFALLQLEILPASISHKLSAKLHLTNNIKSSGTIFGVIVMGIASALTLTPCATPALIGILIYISQTGNPWLGGATLFCLSIGMGVPLLVIAIIGHHILPKAGAWLNTIKHVTGLTLFGIIIWLLERILPSNIISLLCASLMFGIAIYLGILKLKLPTSIWQWLQKLIAFGLLIGTIFLIIITFNNYKLPSFMHNYMKIRQTNNTTANNIFRTINNSAELTTAFIEAKKVGKPILLFFHADWCTYCKKLISVFQILHEQGYAQQFTNLQVDVTTQTEDEIKMMKHYKVLGLPAILFFTAEGIEQKDYRLSEALEVDELKQYINEVLEAQGQ
jgi:thiol:disulfide interchange protein DsbD